MGSARITTKINSKTPYYFHGQRFNAICFDTWVYYGSMALTFYKKYISISSLTCGYLPKTFDFVFLVFT